jgi:hypothetical protein
MLTFLLAHCISSSCLCLLRVLLELSLVQRVRKAVLK